MEVEKEYAKPSEQGDPLETPQEIFKARIKDLRAKAISYFDQMINTDVQNVKDLLKGHQMTEKLLAQLTSLSKQYFVIDNPSQLHQPQNDVPDQKEPKLAPEPQPTPPLEVTLNLQKVKKYKGWFNFLKIGSYNYNYIAF